MWAPRGQKGVKKRLSAWPQGRGSGKLKTFTQIRSEGVKRYSSSVSHFFTGRVRLLGGLGPSAAQWARFRSWALWWSAIADIRAGVSGQSVPGIGLNINERAPCCLCRILVLASGAQYTPRPCQVAPHRDIRPRGTDGRDRFEAIRQQTVLINSVRDEQKIRCLP